MAESKRSIVALYAAVAAANLLAMGLFSLLLEDPWADGGAWPLYRDREKLLRCLHLSSIAVRQSSSPPSAFALPTHLRLLRLLRLPRRPASLYTGPLYRPSIPSSTKTEYCERVRLDEALRTRINSWSNAAFTIMGSWVMMDASTLTREQGRPLGLWIGLGLFFLGVSRYSAHLQMQYPTYRRPEPFFFPDLATGTTPWHAHTNADSPPLSPHPSFVFHASLSRQGHLADLWGTHIATNAELAFMLYRRVKVYFKRASPYHFLALSVGFELFMLTIHSSIVEPPDWGRGAFKTLKRHLWQWDTFVVQVGELSTLLCS